MKETNAKVVALECEATSMKETLAFEIKGLRENMAALANEAKVKAFDDDDDDDV